MSGIITLNMLRRSTHSASDVALYNRVSIPAPPWELEIDATRADTAPRSAPIRKKGHRRTGGANAKKIAAEFGIMDREWQ